MPIESQLLMAVARTTHYPPSPSVKTRPSCSNAGSCVAEGGIYRGPAPDPLFYWLLPTQISCKKRSKIWGFPEIGVPHPVLWISVQSQLQRLSRFQTAAAAESGTSQLEVTPGLMATKKLRCHPIKPAINGYKPSVY